VVVSGRVQGVFFRASCRDRAVSRGVVGWVRNIADGRVEAEFEGPREDVDAIVRWCEVGPPGARVDAVEVHERPPLGEQGFRIERSA
jgi:acylphosphatase